MVTVSATNSEVSMPCLSDGESRTPLMRASEQVSPRQNALRMLEESG